jgi:hypothetical protein
VLDRDPRPLLDHVPADDGRVVGRPAGEDDDPPKVRELLVGDADALEHERPVADTVAERLLDGVRLLVDLLQHERLVAALLRDLVVPVDLQHVALDLAALDADEAGAVGGDRDDLAVLDQLELPRLRDEGGDHRSEEHLAVADADDEWALKPRADEEIRLVAVDDDEREMALELFVRLLHRLDEIAVVVALDQVNDDLGVGLGVERVPLGLERALQLAEVLDDPVQDDGELRVLAADERVGVLLGHAAVRGPAGVAEAGRGDGAVRAGRLAEEGEVSHRADVVEPVVLEEREPGRVVAAVLEPLEAVEQKVLRRSPTDVSDDAAHPEAPLYRLRGCHSGRSSPLIKRGKPGFSTDPFFADG